MSKRRDAFDSPFDEERPFTTAWGEYDPRQQDAWGSDGYTPDWARPYEFPTSTGRESRRNRRQYSAPENPQTPVKDLPSLEKWTPPWGKNWNKKVLPPRIFIAAVAFLGGFLGIHRFVIGDRRTGMIMLFITLFSAWQLAWVSAIWGIIDGYKYIKMSDDEFTYYCYQKEMEVSKG